MKKKTLFFLIFFIGILIGFILQFFLAIEPAETETIPLSNTAYATTLIPLLKDAKEIRIIMFTMTYYLEYPDSKANELLDAIITAKNSGADIKMILEGGEEFLGEDFTVKQKQSCAYLQDEDIDVRFDPSGVDTHAKLVIIDDKVIVSSTNWNYYALEKNNEVAVLTDDSEVRHYFETYFNELWSRSNKVDCGAIEQECNSITQVLSNRNYCDKKTIYFEGIAKNVVFKTSKAGNPYCNFDLYQEDSKIVVYAPFQPNILDGQEILIKGIFSKEKNIGKYTFYDEIEASSIE